MLSNADVIWRLLAAAGLSALLGFERERREQPAGLRTYMLVGVGSCLFALVSAFGFGLFTRGAAANLGVARADVTRISSQIVVGIGFLGAGTIMRHEGAVHGLTTAAGLWVAAAVGLAVAMGFWIGAIAATVLALMSLALKPIARALRRRQP